MLCYSILNLQIADAVVVAKHLGATLVLPNIKGNEPGKKRKFGDIYDVKKFVESLDKKVPLVMDHQATEISNQKVNKVKVPNMVSKEFISSKVEPVFKSTPNIRIATYFPASMEQTRKLNPYACLAVFDTLKLRPELQESIDTMVLTLRSLSSHSQGRFVAVDYRVESLPEGGSKCPDSETSTQNCIDANDIVMHLQKIGFPRETTIYLTLNGWDSSLEHFRKAFPNTYTKDVIIPSNDKSKFLDPEHPELRQIVDIYISSMADVYVPTSSNMFNDNIVARRIAAGKTRVLVPGKGSSDSADDYVPAYISMKRHWAYSCFC
ncbi:unnamed protein product [Cuscuta epithymum]|uniref:O-fucosyltransferase family protein n=2 Tax=Cuscuta epithymum TaxID=186058 RepID=A0AAV0FZ69_9ASTE|nr:unnamed protein product [Cuscuta epithymum]